MFSIFGHSSSQTPHVGVYMCVMQGGVMLVAFGKSLATLIRYEITIRHELSLALPEPPVPITTADRRVVAAAQQLHTAQRTLVKALYSSLSMRSVRKDAGELYHVIELRQSLVSMALSSRNVTVVATARESAGKAVGGKCPLTGAYADTLVSVTLDEFRISVHPAWANVLQLVHFISTLDLRIKEVANFYKDPLACQTKSVVLSAHVMRCVELLCAYFDCDPFAPLTTVRDIHGFGCLT